MGVRDFHDVGYPLHAAMHTIRKHPHIHIKIGPLFGDFVFSFPPASTFAPARILPLLKN